MDRTKASEASSRRRAELPGAEAFSSELWTELEAAAERRGGAYQPRTKHRNGSGQALYHNRLFLESSPYLLQHAHNPVNWYPWGDAAFEAARRLNRPVLLSVGYSTCHWCHVMEEESFEDPEIAGLINERYIPVKVDREERPDVDAIYMASVQALTGQGGWPMTVWLTADRRPYYGGTYFPPRDGDRGARTGFATLLQELHKVFVQEPERVERAATELTDAVRSRLTLRLDFGASSSSTRQAVDDEILHQAFRYYEDRFDPETGGLLPAPKFPSSLPLRFLLRYHRRFRNESALAMAELSLNAMGDGGIYDQVGGGFHRYSVDDKWLVPHFEKMLYDNALLTVAYLEAYQATGEANYARIANDVLRYVDREMVSPEGAFYAATDADSPNPDKGGEREEGWYFTWTKAELEDALEPLGRKVQRMFCAYYGISDTGNFEGRNIPHVARPASGVAHDLGVHEVDLVASLHAARNLLCEARAKRPPPLRDEKVLAAWNGLMISAFVRAAGVLGEPHFLEIGRRGADFLLERMCDAEGRLYRTYTDGRASHRAYLEDYAAVVAALIDLFEASGEARYLREALRLTDCVDQHFWDAEDGGYFMTADDHEALIVREKPAHDGATPSGNSLMALNLLRLAELSDREPYRQRAQALIGAFQGILRQAPAALSELLLAVDFLLDRPKQIIMVTDGEDEALAPFLKELHQAFLPSKVVAIAREADVQSLAELMPIIRGKHARGASPTLTPGASKEADKQQDGTTAYVCVGQACLLPTSDPATFAREILQ